jgi:hypothetical protein
VRRHRLIAGTSLPVVIIAVILAGCSGATPSIELLAPTAEPSASPSAAAPSTPTATPTPAASPVASATSEPSTASGACPRPPLDLAAVRDTARARRAITCFGSASLTFRAYVPTTTDLGGVSGSKMTPLWIADNWTGAIVQPEPLVEQDQNAWLIVRVPPKLGRCAITAVEAKECPFGAHLDDYVTITGHFDDPVATTCKSVAFSPELDPGPAKPEMVARCRAEFVVSAIDPG